MPISNTRLYEKFSNLRGLTMGPITNVMGIYQSHIKQQTLINTSTMDTAVDAAVIRALENFIKSSNNGYISNFLQKAIFGLLLFALMASKKVRNRAGYSSFFSKPSVQKSSRPKPSILKEFGYTLIELMIVLAIVGVLTLFAYPNYQNYLIHTHRNEAKIALLDLANQMEHYYSKHQTYESATVNLNDLSKSYTLSIVKATKTTYLLQAKPINTDAFCQSFTLNQKGKKNITGSPTGTVEQCW